VVVAIIFAGVVQVPGTCGMAEGAFLPRSPRVLGFCFADVGAEEEGAGENPGGEKNFDGPSHEFRSMRALGPLTTDQFNVGRALPFFTLASLAADTRGR
jgi:hypothetical protein